MSTKKPTAKKAAPKKTGRPAGSKTKDKPVEQAVLSRCAKCGSTERAPYTHPRTIETHGKSAAGQPYTHVTFRHTRCLNPACGQVRVDRTEENRVAKGSARAA